VIDGRWRWFDWPGYLRFEKAALGISPEKSVGFRFSLQLTAGLCVDFRPPSKFTD
jgi:hypothetical protein